jgi:methylenetetrahydrofolate dehydrogenase (NAD+)
MHKDVEGLSPKLINNMYQNIRFLDPPHNTQKSILPCTPLAMIKILEYLNIYNTILDYGKRLWGRRITVINRSEVVGRPLAALLANDGAEVYSVDVTGVQRFSRGQGLRNQQHVVEEKPDMTMDDCLAISDVVISGVPGDKFKVPVEKIRDGAVCINFSSEKVSFLGEAAERGTENKRLTRHPQHQQNFTPQVKEHASIYVPAVGKVTIMILLRNLLRMVQNNPAVDAKPAEAIEKKGTVEEVVAA